MPQISIKAGSEMKVDEDDAHIYRDSVFFTGTALKFWDEKKNVEQQI